ncbi:hypothetical protein [Desulfobacca acetoxidans]
MPDIDHNSRIVRPLLGSFSVTIPVHGFVTKELIFNYREAITGAFNDAPREFFEKKYIVNRPIQTHTIVTNVRIGSIEFDVLYQAITELPWAEASQCINFGIHYLKELGEVAGGLFALREMYSWIKKRLRKTPLGNQPAEGDIIVKQTSSLKIETEPIDSIDSIEGIRKRLFGNEQPTCIGTILNNVTLADKVYQINYNKENVPKHLGGVIVTRDLNYYVNGLRSLEDLRPGDIFFFNNQAALGLQKNLEPASLYLAVGKDNPDVDLLSVKLQTHEVPDVSPPTHRSRRPVDADDLEDA